MDINRPSNNEPWVWKAISLFAIFTSIVILEMNVFGQTAHSDFVGFVFLQIVFPVLAAAVWVLLDIRARTAAYSWIDTAKLIVLLGSGLLLFLALLQLLHPIIEPTIFRYTLCAAISCFCLFAVCLLTRAFPFLRSI